MGGESLVGDVGALVVAASSHSARTLGSVAVVVAAASSAMVRYLLSGQPRQLI